ncbi:MAG: hypothetical protein R3C59_00145 [Planctomycetaceae bacterium]
MTRQLYNNFGIFSLGIAFTSQAFGSVLSLPKALLVAPFLSHQALLDHLSRQNSVVSSIEKLLVQKTVCFSNFNARYYDSLCGSINAIQFLVDVEVAQFRPEGIEVVTAMVFDRRMGSRAEKIMKAAPRLASLFESSDADLYSALRIQL